MFIFNIQCKDVLWVFLLSSILTKSSEGTHRIQKRGSSQRRIDEGGSLFSFALPFLKSLGLPKTSVEFNGAKLSIKSEAEANARNEDVSGRITTAPRCTTPNKGNGKCLDIQYCPILLADFATLRKSICFKTGFVPGVCCPDQGVSLLDFGTTDTKEENDKFEENEVINDHSNDSIKGDSTNATSINQNESPQCGISQKPQSRIVGGKATYEGEYPWMAAIYLHGGGRTEFWCGGALVSERHVITAAHCTKDAKKKQFKARQFTIRLGEWDLDDKETYSREYEIVDVIAHPDFKANGFYSDVAILKTIEPVEFSEYIQPICLPTGSMKNDNFLGTLPVALGWGATHYRGKEVNKLRGVALPVWNNKDCDGAYFQPITEVFLCAGYASGGRDACQGDSGGPLMLYSQKRKAWVLIGVVSFGNR
uniref:limulus clotting factor C n=1 Tax=Lepeophtheirus salmonis TaxID=72036 RepID=A0A0K2U4G1_LEPSM